MKLRAYNIVEQLKLANERLLLENISLKQENSRIKQELTVLKQELTTLKQENSRLHNKIDHLESLINQQVEDNLSLTKLLKKNSKNSSKPPSTDVLSNKKKITCLRTKTSNPTGGQLGHKGETLKQVSNPDEIVREELHSCTGCHASLEEVSANGIVKRQVFDIILPKKIVKEYQAETKTCPSCQKSCTASFPEAVSAPVQYGTHIEIWAIYLLYVHLLPENRVQQIFKDLVGLPICTATFQTFSKAIFDRLEGYDGQLLEDIKQEAVKHMDETGFRIGGKREWLHVISTNLKTHYHISPSRKASLTGAKGILVHDHWKSYYKIKGVEHSLCNQHHLRELEGLIEEKEDWAKDMSRLLRFMLRYRQTYPEEIDQGKLMRMESWYDQVIAKGISYHENLPPLVKSKNSRGRPQRRVGYNLVLRLQEYKKDVLRFLYNPLVPFTNNQAEQDLRMMKCKQKISGGFRSQPGAEMFARIRSFLSTTRKQGLNLLEAIQAALTGRLHSYA